MQQKTQPRCHWTNVSMKQGLPFSGAPRSLLLNAHLCSLLPTYLPACMWTRKLFPSRQMYKSLHPAAQPTTNWLSLFNALGMNSSWSKSSFLSRTMKVQGHYPISNQKIRCPWVKYPSQVHLMCQEGGGGGVYSSVTLDTIPRKGTRSRTERAIVQKICWGGDHLGDFFVLNMIMIIYLNMSVATWCLSTYTFNYL